MLQMCHKVYLQQLEKLVHRCAMVSLYCFPGLQSPSKSGREMGGRGESWKGVGKGGEGEPEGRQAWAVDLPLALDWNQTPAPNPVGHIWVA